MDVRFAANMIPVIPISSMNIVNELNSGTVTKPAAILVLSNMSSPDIVMVCELVVYGMLRYRDTSFGIILLAVTF